MNDREAQEVIRMVESNWQTDFGADGRALWRNELSTYDPNLAVKAVAFMARIPLPNGRARPTLADFRAVYFKVAKDAEVAAAGPAIEVSPMRKPPWVTRWQRARAAGDPRPFPEQAPGYEELRRSLPTDLNREAYALPHVSHDSREHWVQPDEYLNESAPQWPIPGASSTTTGGGEDAHR